MSEHAGLARVGVRGLRNDVSALLRRAADGERIVITVDGRPTAQLGPLAPGDHGPTLDDLAAAGLIDPPRQGVQGSTDRSLPNPFSVAADVRLDRLIEQIRGR
jgi:prevent-host-death family protein